MKNTLLLDSDIIAYKFAASNQMTFDWDSDGDTVTHVNPIEDAMSEVNSYIEDLAELLEGKRLIVCLSCSSADNWRKTVLPTYKANRANVVHPVLLSAVKNKMREQYETAEYANLEADDVMGILSTHPTLIPGNKVIVSEDKDMKTIPGLLYNPRSSLSVSYISEQEADYRHLYQTLVGDPTDFYKGCPGIGEVKAKKLLLTEDSKYLDVSTMWRNVVKAFEAKGLTEDDALVQARVARICRVEDYDFDRHEVRLWLPPKDNTGD